MKPAHAEETSLSWSVHLSTGQPKRQVQVGLVLLATLLLGCALFHSLWLGLLPMLALLFSLSEYVFPIRYLLTAQSASMRCGVSHLEIRWADVRHAYLADDGIKLSPLTAQSRWESLRGIFLRFGEGNREQIVDTVRRFRAEAVHG